MLKNAEICYNADNKNIGCDLLRIIGKIDIEKFKGISENIITDEVVLTDERIRHIQERHPNDFEEFVNYIPDILLTPDYIMQDKNIDTAILLKTVKDNGKKIQLVLRLHTNIVEATLKNSILTMLKIDEKTWGRYIRNKKIIYKNG